TADSNISGTINVFEAARTVRIRKVIYAETSAIYEGSSLFPTPESEEKPVSFYACSKLAASLFARSYIRLYGMNLTGLRYFNVYGPRQDYRRSIPPVFSAFMISLLKKRKPVIYGDGKKRRDFVYVDDVNNFHLLAMQDDRTNGNIYNIGSGKNFSIQEMYDLICSLVGVKVRPRYAQDLPGEAQITLADISLARSLGWEPKVDLAAGLKETLNFIKTHVMRKL
ncbi:MAG: NAD-dependent epimerase/dehydratase family protein, partial [Candidatus Omnitrophica bacterium]|nr:NAD-dependent epimerase/dehydratase family protein [Candidatus Omnitrophota bacterium]